MLIALLVLATLAVIAAYLVELARLIRTDRPTYSPRSHSHEIDPVSRPFARL